jgi:hypothetical protein
MEMSQHMSVKYLSLYQMLMLDSACAAEENSIPLVWSCIFLFTVIVHIAVVMIPAKFQNHDFIPLSPCMVFLEGGVYFSSIYVH